MTTDRLERPAAAVAAAAHTPRLILPIVCALEAAGRATATAAGRSSAGATLPSLCLSSLLGSVSFASLPSGVRELSGPKPPWAERAARAAQLCGFSASRAATRVGEGCPSPPSPSTTTPEAAAAASGGSSVLVSWDKRLPGVCGRLGLGAQGRCSKPVSGLPQRCTVALGLDRPAPGPAPQ